MANPLPRRVAPIPTPIPKLGELVRTNRGFTCILDVLERVLVDTGYSRVWVSHEA